jgi:acetyl-CoA C-acetyltransferase
LSKFYFIEDIRMREVAIIGIGQTPVDEHWDKSLKELAGEAILAALSDADRVSAESLFIGNMLSGILSKQENIGGLISDWIGLPGMEAEKVEAACGSGAAAFRAGLMAVSSEEVDSALVVGVEKMTESLPSETTEALATAADADYEAAQGLSFVAINALVMQLYLHTYGWKHTDFAPFSINAHANALHNPFARLHEKITEKDYVNAKMVADPINLLDASPTGDGAAAVLLVPADSIDRRNQRIIKIIGSASATDSIAVHSRKDPLWLSAAEKSVRKAYSQAGLGPADIDFFELHDAFSIMSVLSLEACGFADRGKGPELAQNGDILLKGRIPITTRGGLKARGHPVGATGMYQIVEAVQQLRREAAPTQVEGARIGMTQNIGGSGATIVTHILASSK